ncbi:uncharacterized protein L3040_005033 [Drepanopeziza brunnea f. sp. 'multigermtubi']|uniref:Eukaryotic aspartyl protease n=1 Tax=Marssonina brunnea f. sp. multigermtubi (strain MB_m1) TaxID=1072389 RepID=K1WWI1_MARBU|nr:eukaryotic aspartyl protease [Drepanopeziza brunnea f. sp. 'multigermtubi' MB_m1]EKD17431.1 eukaryotic aspartyl protease [Drepanopeziza brunnea f. sp. 'multigermtubi' MB_m1]KAJ5042489.1 hypothetical protein L3040_005033 [Drepanopeziza brunnea f. sp. 'multigermtubi']
MMDSRWLRVLGVAASLVRCAEGDGKALSVPPSEKWYGDDGTWSAVSLRVGTPQQWIDVMVSTASSETWVVGDGGCGPGDTQCVFTRGGTFAPSKSSTWKDQGLYELGASQQLGNNGVGLYGLDTLTFGGSGVTISSAIIGAFNGTGPIHGASYLLGFFGVGIIPGAFNNIAPLSAVSALVEEVGAIPSYSWGYTAGAHYRQKGTVASLTLGGFDLNRFINHDTNFNLNAAKQLLTSINKITVSSSQASNNWTAPVQLLSTTDQVSAVFDSSTPFLWLPPSVCERFATALGLSYNTSLNLYTFDDNPSQHDVLAASQLSFTFTFADMLSAPSTVDITLPYDAFDLQLKYPAIPGTGFGDPDATKYYFPLRQAENEAQYTIGRAFLQEAYLIADYERNTFSIFQALHPSDSVTNTSIHEINPPSDSPLTGGPGTPKASKLTTGAIIGISAGAFVSVASMAVAIVYLCFRKRQKQARDSDSEKSSSSSPSSLPRSGSPLDHEVNHKATPPPIHIHEVDGNTSYPTEVGADATHERFELPAPLGPVELDGESCGSTQDSSYLSAYECARRKMERQQAEFAATQGAGASPPRVEKSETDISHMGHYRAPDTENQHFRASTSSETQGDSPPIYDRINPANVVYAGRLPDNVQPPGLAPPLFGRDGRVYRPEVSGPPPDMNTNSSLGSELTFDAFYRNLCSESSGSNTDLYGASTGSIGSHLVSPLQSAPSESGARIGGTNTVSPLDNSSPDALWSERAGYAQGGSSRENPVLDQLSSRNRLDGEDLIHVPQLAERRFSWEHERTRT